MTSFNFSFLVRIRSILSLITTVSRRRIGCRDEQIATESEDEDEDERSKTTRAPK